MVVQRGRHLERIAASEAVHLIGLSYAGGLAFAPIHVFSAAEYSGWIGGLISLPLGLGICLLWARAAAIDPSEELPGVAPRLLGRPAGWLVNLAIAVLFLVSTAADVRITGEVLLQLMPETPLAVFVVFTLIFAALACRLGLEVMARVATLHTHLIVFTFFLVLVALGPILEADAFLPVLESGWTPVLSAAAAPAAHVARVTLIALAAPSVAGVAAGPSATAFRRLAGVLLLGGGMSWLYQFTFIALEQGVFGPMVAARMTFPALELVREIRFGLFFERVEAAMVAVWLPSIFLQVATFLYGTALVLKHLAGATAYRGFVFPLAVGCGLLSIYGAADVWRLARFVNGPWLAFALAVEAGVPLLMLGARQLGRAARGARDAK